MAGRAYPFWLDASRRGAIGPFGVSDGARQAGPGSTGFLKIVAGSAPRDVVVETVDCEAAAAFVAQWRDLAERSLEANVYNEPSFVLAAALHLAGSNRRPQFLFVWEAVAPSTRGALLAVWPIGPRRRRGVTPITRIWTHKQATLATPLLDRWRAAEAIDAIVDHFRRTAPGVAGLMFPLLPIDGPTAALLRERAAADGGALRILDPQERAVLSHGANPDTFLDASVTPKRLNKLRRARGRLAARGEVAIRILRDPCQVRPATEDFLVLEARGWKGRRRTALLSTPQLATFTRAMLRALASQGACRVYSLDVGGASIAMAIVLTGGDRAFIWKVAYDEAFAAFSPGVQLTLELTRTLLADDAIALTDSCAAANHPMIDHIWPQRMTIADACIAIDPSRAKAFAAAMERETLWRNVRSRLKDIVYRLRGWKRS
jgi:CelD/BcsL family acetyltransferase involved in cellulose biosynthesis